MSSWQHKLIVMWLRLSRRKRIYASIQGLYAGIEQTRRVGPALPDRRMRRLLAVSDERIAGQPVYHLAPKAPQTPTRHLFYLHGGAYVRPITRHHWHLLQELVLDTGCCISVPLYPLAPEASCEAVLAFVRQAYAKAQLSAGNQPLLLAGDSAGAGLVLALATVLRDQGLRLPEHLLLICPWVDLTLGQPRSLEQQRRDPMLASEGAAEAARLYAGNLALDHPWVSPLFADLQGLPSMTVWSAGNDLIGSDAVRLAELARQQGCAVDLQIASEMIHVWPLLPTPEAQQARAYFKAIVVR